MLNNKVLILMGPSGSGKTTLACQLEKLYGVPQMVSTTTRAKRPGEQHGVDYYYVSKEEFDQTPMVEETIYSGHQYGLSLAEANRKLMSNKLCSVVVDVNGLEQMQEHYPGLIISVFCEIDEHRVWERMLQRGDSPEKARERLWHAKASHEFDNWIYTNYIVSTKVSVPDSLQSILIALEEHKIILLPKNYQYAV